MTTPEPILSSDHQYVLNKLFYERKYHTDHPQAILVRVLFTCVLYAGAVLFAVIQGPREVPSPTLLVVALVMAFVGLVVTLYGIGKHTSQHLSKLREIEAAITNIFTEQTSFTDEIRDAGTPSATQSAGLFSRQPDPCLVPGIKILLHDCIISAGVVLLVAASILGVLAYSGLV